MKHIIFSFLIAVLILFCSCDAVPVRQTDTYYIINQTDKAMVHVLYSAGNFDTEDKVDTLTFYVPTQCDTTFEWTISEVVGYVDLPCRMDYRGFHVYNITDTTSIFFEASFSGFADIPQIFKGVYKGTIIDSKKHEQNDITNYYLTVNDHLLSLMQKDYSMLERFKEYYQK